jgi:hypothetical protein
MLLSGIVVPYMQCVCYTHTLLFPAAVAVRRRKRASCRPGQCWPTSTWRGPGWRLTRSRPCTAGVGSHSEPHLHSSLLLAFPLLSSPLRSLAHGRCEGTCTWMTHARTHAHALRRRKAAEAGVASAQHNMVRATALHYSAPPRCTETPAHSSYEFSYLMQAVLSTHIAVRTPPTRMYRGLPSRGS